MAMGIRRNDLESASSVQRGPWTLRRSIVFIAAISVLFWIGVAGISGWIYETRRNGAMIVTIEKGEPGSVTARRVAPGSELLLQFDSADALVQREGVDLVIRFSDGASLRLEEFVSAARSSSPPKLRDRAGLLVPADLVLEQIKAASAPARLDEALRIMPAAGR